MERSVLHDVNRVTYSMSDSNDDMTNVRLSQYIIIEKHAFSQAKMPFIEVKA